MKKNVVTGSGAGISLIDENLLKSKVYTIRGVKVMLDADLAEIYGYSVKAFNQQVKNNILKFPEGFRFQLSHLEYQNMKSKILTSSWGGVRKMPFAFTEQGVYMLMTVLKGELATRQSLALVRFFKDMKDYIVAENQHLLGCANCTQIATLTARHSQEIAEIRSDVTTLKIESREVQDSLGKVMEYFHDPSTYKHHLILNGQKFEADVANAQIYGMAQESVIVIDNYLSVKTLDLLRGVVQGVKVTILSDQYAGCCLTPQVEADFRAARPDVVYDLKPADNKFHDRYIVLDFGTEYEKMFHCGASSKDAGGKITTIMQIEDVDVYRAVIEGLL